MVNLLKRITRRAKQAAQRGVERSRAPATIQLATRMLAQCEWGLSVVHARGGANSCSIFSAGRRIAVGSW